MKTIIKRLVDYRTVPFDKEIVISCPEEHVQKEFRHIVRAHKRTEKAEMIAAGDVVVLKLKSEFPKFNKSMVPVTVGGGLYDAELEEKLIGHCTGETFSVTVQAPGSTPEAGEPVPVEVTVLQASRTIFPEADDEMVRAYAADKEELAGISTVEAYRNKVIEDYLEQARNEAFYSAMQQIADQVLAESEVIYDEEEVAEICRKEIDYERQVMKETEGIDFDALTDEEILQNFGIATRKKLEELVTRNTKQRLVMTIWSAMCRGKDPAVCTVDDEDSMDFEFLEQYVRENLTIKEER